MQDFSELHKEYRKKLDEMQSLQKKCIAGVRHQRYRLRWGHLLAVFCLKYYHDNGSLIGSGDFFTYYQGWEERRVFQPLHLDDLATTCKTTLTWNENALGDLTCALDSAPSKNSWVTSKAKESRRDKRRPKTT